MASSSSNWSSGNTAIVPGMMGVYNQLLGLNQQNYQNILRNYGQAQNFASARLGQIEAGYGRLQNQVLRTLGVQGGGWGVATPAAQAIRDAFVQRQGATDQQMINSGLGNTTVRAQAQNQNAAFAGQAYGNLGAQLANTAAGYISNLGLAAQQQRMQGLGVQNQLAQQLMGNLAQYRFANTAGDLTGSFQSSGASSQSFDSPGGGGGGRGGSRGGGSDMGGLGDLFRDPVDWTGGGRIREDDFRGAFTQGYANQGTYGGGQQTFSPANYYDAESNAGQATFEDFPGAYGEE